MTDDNQQHPTDRPVPQPPEPTMQGWRERTLGLRGVVAVALASVILGGAGGVALGALSNDDDNDDGGRPGFGPGGGPGQFQQQAPQDGGSGVPPGMTPPDDVQPDSEGDTSSSGDTT